MQKIHLINFHYRLYADSIDYLIVPYTKHAINVFSLLSLFCGKIPVFIKHSYSPVEN